MAGFRRILLAALGAIVAAALVASTAAAATTTTPATTATPAEASLVLYLRGTYSLHNQQVTIPHRSVKVQGTVSHYVPGQWVKMRVYVGSKLAHTYGVRIRPSSNGSSGTVSYRVSSPDTGKVTVLVSHDATSTLGSFTARHGFTALNPNAGFGATGPFVQLVQARLAALHFYIPQTGVYDQGTGLAVDAYHRLLRWGTYQTLDQRTIDALLNGTGSFHVRYPGDGRHAEGDLSDQLLALTNGSHVEWIFPISSGKPSTPTVLGRFHVYLRDPGYLSDGMYYSDFFYSGYAIHGYDPAPDYPASHGCMRLPIVDAIPAFNWLAIGDAVDVYYE
jgi:hypothetical protein